MKVYQRPQHAFPDAVEVGPTNDAYQFWPIEALILGLSFMRSLFKDKEPYFAGVKCFLEIDTINL